MTGDADRELDGGEGNGPGCRPGNRTCKARGEGRAPTSHWTSIRDRDRGPGDPSVCSWERLTFLRDICPGQAVSAASGLVPLSQIAICPEKRDFKEMKYRANISNRVSSFNKPFTFPVLWFLSSSPCWAGLLPEPALHPVAAATAWSWSSRRT